MNDTHEVSDEEIVAVKQRLLTPAMPRLRGTFQCPLCHRRYDVDGNCDVDDIPLRRVPDSEQ